MNQALYAHMNNKRKMKKKKESLPNKCETLSSNPSTTKKKEELQGGWCTEIYLFLVGLGFELRALCLQSKCSTA
jgi:hypothetical protein